MKRSKMDKLIAFMKEVAELEEGGVFVPSFITGPIKAAYETKDEEELKRLVMEMDEAITRANFPH